MTKHEADVIGGLDMTDQISNDAYRQIMVAAEDAPPEWIPVDQDKYPEGYPEAFQPVWITDEYNRVYHMSYNGRRRIKAWMPFIVPEPYEAKNE